MKAVYSLLLCTLCSSSGTALAVGGPGPAPPGTAIAQYYVGTGEISVSVNSIVNWSLMSSSAGLTGPDSGMPPLPAGGGIASSDDTQIGEGAIAQFSYTGLFLGEVAQSGLPPGDLNIEWVATLGGGDPISQPVVYINPIPEPASLLLAVIGFSCMGRRRCRRT